MNNVHVFLLVIWAYYITIYTKGTEFAVFHPAANQRLSEKDMWDFVGNA